MGIRITIPLSQQELTALIQMSSVACRHPRDHAYYLIRAEAVRLGLLPEAEAIDVHVKVREEAQDEKSGSK